MGGRCDTFALVVCLGAGAAGCSIQERYADGALVSRALSFAALQPVCDGSGSALVTTTTLGPAISSDEAMLGYRRTEQVCVPQECKAVFWVRSTADVTAVLDLMRAGPGLCATTGGEVR
jgi:hypothetical protein